MARSQVAPFIGGVLSGIVVGVALCVSGGEGTPTPQASPTIATSATPACSRPFLSRDNVLIKVNEYRLEKGLKQLAVDFTLEDFAQLRADELKASNAVGHKSKYGDFYRWAADNKKPNIATKGLHELIVYTVTNPCQAIELWRNSPTHNDALVTPEATHIGIGVNSDIVVLQVGLH